MSILNKIKKGVENSGSNKSKVLYLKADSKVRVRFLKDVEDAIELTMHDSFNDGINAVCQKHFGRDCPYCDDDRIRTREAFFWPVWEHDQKEVKIFHGMANNFNPLPNLIAMYESYGTLKDRDYVIQRDGKGTNTRYSVVPMDKAKFKNSKAKPFSDKKIMSILDKAFPVDDEDKVDDVDDEDVEVDDDNEAPEDEYEDMSPKELYAECLERGIKVKKKQKAKYYIDLLVEDDLEGDNEDDWDDDEDDDDGDW